MLKYNKYVSKYISKIIRANISPRKLYTKRKNDITRRISRTNVELLSTFQCYSYLFQSYRKAVVMSRTRIDRFAIVSVDFDKLT